MKSKMVPAMAAIGLVLMFVGIGLGPVRYQSWVLGASFGLIIVATILQMRARPHFVPDRWPLKRRERKHRTRQPGQIHLD